VFVLKQPGGQCFFLFAQRAHCQFPKGNERRFFG
jgi:hypothetical protein